MRKLIALAALLAWMPVANAADSKGEFTHNAEYRIRYQVDQGFADGGDAEADNDLNKNTASHRFKLDTHFRSGEKFAAHLALVFAGDLGGTAGNGDGVDSEIATPDSTRNAILVNEAYGTWMINDSWSMKFGRGGFTMGNGAVVARNDWEQIPTSFDGLMVNWEHEMMRVGLFAVKAEEGLTSALTAITDDTDQETNFFGISLDWKSLPEFLKVANLHFMDTRSDTSYRAAASGEYSVNQMRYGLALAGDMAGVDYKADYAVHTGEQVANGTTGDVEGNMWQVEVGYNMPEMMKTRIHLAYHVDTGDNDTTDADSKTYNKFYYERHNSAGMMDIFQFGNLTFITAGVAMSPMDNLEVALNYWKFERTESGASAGGATAGRNGGGFTGTATSADLGQELDLVATKKYDGGFAIQAWYGMFMPGGYYDNATDGLDQTYNQFFVEGKMTF